ncbi:N-formylglutamate amidohydrolase [Oceaniglobus trochenteri]|uniref:N-formylglutamate amidohydrolase n=1 Tax=Oceaniglobus trochenteri TaxID=2763260 RepID=UPI001CFF6D44|nr:N-formylglutamate amidohydrolase [Oceaniglobus trochenteri]
MTHARLAPLLSETDGPPVEVLNPSGKARLVLVCEHASPVIPEALGNLGLAAGDRMSHAVWDPGAFDLALALSDRLNAPLVAARFSRLAYDCNRPPEAASSMPAQSERITVPGNANLTSAQRNQRSAALYDPFHAALADQIARMNHPAIVTVHSFTPVFHGAPRTVELGVLFDPRDERLGRALLSAPGNPLRTEANAPYGPGDGVLHTLERHALAQNLPNAMLEIRNDLLKNAADIARIADVIEVLLAHGLDQTPAKGHPA